MTREHDPLNDEPDLLSPEKRAWCSGAWTKRGAKTPRIAVFQFAMNTAMRPTSPKETIAFGYMNLNKFHDREPEKVLEVIEALDPDFFDSYPRKAKTVIDAVYKKAIISELARAFYRHGLAAYGKPGLRKPGDPIAGL